MTPEIAAAAGRDLGSIYDYTIQRWGAAQADRYAAALEAAISGLADRAGTGAQRGGYRRVRCGSHFIFYRRIGKRIRVERVLHERMDFPRHLA
jgi:toxin ParE1/3/4